MSTVSKIAKTLLLISLKALPGGDVATRVFNEDVDKILDYLIPTREKQSDLQRLVTQIAERISARASTLQKNSGAAPSAAFDFLASIQAADITFSRIVEADFDPVRLQTYVNGHRPADWNLASNYRRQFWDEAVEDYCQALLNHFLDSQRFQTELMILLYRQQNQILQALERNRGQASIPEIGSGGGNA